MGSLGTASLRRAQPEQPVPPGRSAVSAARLAAVPQCRAAPTPARPGFAGDRAGQGAARAAGGEAEAGGAPPGHPLPPHTPPPRPPSSACAGGCSCSTSEHLHPPPPRTLPAAATLLRATHTARPHTRALPGPTRAPSLPPRLTCGGAALACAQLSNPVKPKKAPKKLTRREFIYATFEDPAFRRAPRPLDRASGTHRGASHRPACPRASAGAAAGTAAGAGAGTAAGAGAGAGTRAAQTPASAPTPAPTLTPTPMPTPTPTPTPMPTPRALAPRLAPFVLSLRRAGCVWRAAPRRRWCRS